MSDKRFKLPRKIVTTAGTPAFFRSAYEFASDTYNLLQNLVNAVIDLENGVTGGGGGEDVDLTNVETLLTTIAARLAPPTAGWFAGQNTDIDTTSEDLGSQALSKGLYVKNISTAGQIVYLSQTTATSTNSWQLLPGEVSPFIEATNVSQIKVIASANNAAASWSGQ